MDSNVHLIITEDGSHSLKNDALDETYHSFHGAVQESDHIFIKNGLQHWCENFEGKPRILEIGFGTGLNAYLTLLFAEEHKRAIAFDTLETFLLPKDIYSHLNYPTITGGPQLGKYFESLHTGEWGKAIAVTPYFTIRKTEASVHDFHSDQLFDIVYFDAFAPNKQPDMWTMEVIQKMYDLLAINGYLVTYCAQGQFKRNLKQAGFSIEALPGPPGKMEMVRAVKQKA